MTLNEVEREAVILATAWGMIDDMVNFAIFEPLKNRTEETNLVPRTTQSLRLFNILVGDFLSPLVSKGGKPLPFGLAQPPKDARTTDYTFLFYLREVCASPELSGDAGSLRTVVEAFSFWLEQKSFVEAVWLPSIGLETNVSVERRTWIKLCADIGKHSLVRLQSSAAKIERLLTDEGHSPSEGAGYLVLTEFWEWFHTHLFAYHASTIAEFLNEIRWAIFAYLKPEFERSFHRLHPDPAYGFHVPSKITNPLARSMYWDVMNLCRGEPWFPRFTVTQSLKKAY
jgi:hypothetical protein